jgi:hypothetical protein
MGEGAIPNLVFFDLSTADNKLPEILLKKSKTSVGFSSGMYSISNFIIFDVIDAMANAMTLHCE